MRLARGAAGLCRTIHGFSSIALLTSWVRVLIAPGNVVPVALPAIVFGSRLRGHLRSVSVERRFGHGGAQSMRGRRTQSRT